MVSRVTIKTKWDKAVVPFFICLAMGYIDFASFYSLGFEEIYNHHSKGVAIVFWTLLGIIELLIILYWVLIIIKGPGTYVSEDNETEPDYFICDEFGYRIWCSNCQSYKLPRSKHMNKINKCVRKADHFCVWIGAIIGQDNYVCFMKFTICFIYFFIVLIVFLARFTKSNIDRSGEINHNFIVLYIVSGFWVIMLLGLIGSHIYYICINRTTLEDLFIRRIKKEKRLGKNDENQLDPSIIFLNVKHGDLRLVVQCSVFDNIFHHGMKRNWINCFLHNNNDFSYPSDSYTRLRFLGSLMVCFVPLIDLMIPKTKLISTPALSPRFSQHVEEKIRNRRCYLPLQMKPDTSETCGLSQTIEMLADSL